MCIKNIEKNSKKMNLVMFLIICLAVQFANTTTLPLLSHEPSDQTAKSSDLNRSISAVDETVISDQIDKIIEESFKDLFEEPTTTTTTVAPVSRDVSKTTMDIITIIWYLSTFLALAAFFFLMACSDRKCGRNPNQSSNNEQSNDDQLNCPPTPSPSYSEFAPPSYESIIKENNFKNNQIYVVPIDEKLVTEKFNHSTTNLTDCKLHTVNELQKSS